MQTIALVGHGTYFDCRALLKTYAVVIALDGGYEFCKKNGVTPTVVLGDGDSIVQPPADFIKLSDQTTTDLQKGIQYIEQHYHDYQIDLFGCTSHDRLDHTLAAIQSLTQNDQIHCLYTPYQVLRIIRQSFTQSSIDEFSLLPVTATATVELTGCQWSGPFTLDNTYSGLSNRAIQDIISITVRSGIVLFIGSVQWI